MSERCEIDHTAFKPNSYEGKPRHLPAELSAELRELLAKIDAHVAFVGDDKRERLLQACLQVSPINCGWDEMQMAEVVFWRLYQHSQSKEPTP